MPKRRGNKVEIYVPIDGGLKYGWVGSEKVLKTYGLVLGQAPATGVPGVFYGANSPKPNTARRSEESTTGGQAQNNGSRVSSFCAKNKINELKKAGWKIIPTSTIRGIKTSGVTVTVYVEMPGGYNYAWNYDSTEQEYLPILGITKASASTENLVWGSFPKPPRASKEIGGSQTSTFIEPKANTVEKAVAAGWSVTGVAYELAA
jgi:hypothetical protein